MRRESSSPMRSNRLPFLAVTFLIGAIPATSQAASLTSPGALALPSSSNHALQSVQFEANREIDRFLDRYEFRDSFGVYNRPVETFVEGCRRGVKYRLMFDDQDRYVAHRRLGDCSRAETRSRRDVVRELERDNYDNILFVRSTDRDHEVRACRNGRQLMLIVDDRGRVERSERMGRCGAVDDGSPFPPDTDPVEPAEPMSNRDLRDSLQRRGYTQIRFSRSNNPRRVRACQGIHGFEMTFETNGLVESRRFTGFCEREEGQEYVPPRPNLDEIDLRSREPLHPETCQEIVSHLQYRTPILFATGASRILRRSEPLLRTIADNFARCPDVRITIQGHTDSTGSGRDNRRLSRERAQAVRDRLRELGVPRRVMRARGFGRDHPIASNDTEAGQDRNRRIDLVLEWGLYSN